MQMVEVYVSDDKKCDCFRIYISLERSFANPVMLDSTHNKSSILSVQYITDNDTCTAIIIFLIFLLLVSQQKIFV